MLQTWLSTDAAVRQQIPARASIFIGNWIKAVLTDTSGVAFADLVLTSVSVLFGPNDFNCPRAKGSFCCPTPPIRLLCILRT